MNNFYWNSWIGILKYWFMFQQKVTNFICNLFLNVNFLKEDIVTLRMLITYATHFTESIRLSVAGKIH